MSTSDCLLWIGAKASIPKFVKEAEQRGCCRKVPLWPDWLRPGQSRVFLAHKDGLGPQNAVIFGYFVLAGVDAVMDDGKLAEYRRLWQTQELGTDPQPFHSFWRQELGARVPADLSKDGGRPRPVGSGSTLSDGLIDFFVDALLDCGGPKGKEPLVLPVFRTLLESKRLCGVRPFDYRKIPIPPFLASPALYLVDALTREVDRRFCELVKEVVQETLKGMGKDSPASGAHRGLTKTDQQRLRSEVTAAVTKRGLFTEALARVELPAPPAIPEVLAGHAEALRTLVLFDAPHPVFHRLPRAFFRGPIAVDGDRLLTQIAATYDPLRLETLSPWQARQVSLPYVHAVGPKLTQAELVAELAQECQINKTLAHDFLQAFVSAVGSELQHYGRVPIAGLGVFTVREHAARRGRNPATGALMTIPAGKRVHFRPAEGLILRPPVPPLPPSPSHR